MGDLTERLAAKLRQLEVVDPRGAPSLADDAPKLLPLLLSEPELVAGLSPEVRLSVLTPRERAVMKLGEAGVKVASAARAWEAMGRQLEDCPQAFAWSRAVDEYDAALAEAKALTPEVGNG